MINVHPCILYICVFVTCVLVYLCIFICTLLRYIKYIVLGLNIKDKQQLAQRQAAWVSKVVAQSFGHNFPVLPMDTVKWQCQWSIWHFIIDLQKLGGWNKQQHPDENVSLPNFPSTTSRRAAMCESDQMYFRRRGVCVLFFSPVSHLQSLGEQLWEPVWRRLCSIWRPPPVALRLSRE